MTRDRGAPPMHAVGMTESHLARGAAAEMLAADYLQTRGLLLVARNLRCKSGEIDLVCYDGSVLVMVEVRQRSRSDFGGALGSVTRRKQRKLVRAAQYLGRHRPCWSNFPMRFDVVAIQGRPDGIHTVEWIRDAFRAR